MHAHPHTRTHSLTHLAEVGGLGPLEADRLRELGSAGPRSREAERDRSLRLAEREVL